MPEQLSLLDVAPRSSPSHPAEEESFLDEARDDRESGDDLEWKQVLAGERDKEYFRQLMSFVDSERRLGRVIYPPNSEIFNALQLTPFRNVKAVILGQDPYHGEGQAHGLCFSVRRGVAKPPSLVNIFKELQSDLGMTLPSHGCLEEWAAQGVLLLNTCLTVESSKPQSHSKLGWEKFTDRVIAELSSRKKGLVFLLWGSHAQRKQELIDRDRHHVLLATHPSPFSADRGFFGCRHFSKTNAILSAEGHTPIDWEVRS